MDLNNAQRAIRLRELELEIIALEEGRRRERGRFVVGPATLSNRLDGGSQDPGVAASGGRVATPARRRTRIDWDVAWENYDYLIQVTTQRNAERFKAIVEAKGYLLLEQYYRDLGDIVRASDYAHRSWAITTSLGYSAYRDRESPAELNPFEDAKLRAWFEYGWKERESGSSGNHR